MRTRDLLNHTVEENKAMYLQKMNYILDDKDYNLELFKTKVSLYYNKLIEGQMIYNVVAPINGKMKSTDFETRMKAYLEEKNDTGYASLITLLDLDKKVYGDKKKTCEDKKKLYSFFKQVMNVVFDVDVEVTSRGARNKDCKNFNNKEYEISFDSYNALKDKYDPSKLKVTSDLNLLEVDEGDDIRDELLVSMDDLENGIQRTLVV
jgi:hypothetical protein